MTNPASQALNQPLNQFFNQQLNMSIRLGQLSMEHISRLAKLQLDIAKQYLQHSANTSTRVAAIQNPQDMAKVHQDLRDSLLDSVLGVSRNFYDMATQTQSEVNKLIEEQINAFNQSLAMNMDNAIKASPSIANMMMASLKSNIASTTSTMDNLSKAGKQVADFTDASIRAATVATVDAIKSSATLNIPRAT